jgi:hypothetical protein
MADEKLFFGLLLSLICGTMWTPIGDQKIGGERVRSIVEYEKMNSRR